MTRLDALNKKLKLTGKNKLDSTPLGVKILEVFYGIMPLKSVKQIMKEQEQETQ